MVWQTGASRNDTHAYPNRQAGRRARQGAPSGLSLVRLLPGCLPGPCATVIGLDDERILLLQLAVDGALGTEPAFSRCLVEHHGLKGQLLALYLECTDFSCRRQKERASILRTARLHTELQLDQTYTPKSPRPFPSTQIIVKPEAAFREPAELVPFWDGNNRISPIQCSWQKKHGGGEGSHHAGELAVHPSLPVFLAGFLPALCPV